jgi:hypothetical protein
LCNSAKQRYPVHQLAPLIPIDVAIDVRLAFAGKTLHMTHRHAAVQTRPGGRELSRADVIGLWTAALVWGLDEEGYFVLGGAHKSWDIRCREAHAAAQLLEQDAGRAGCTLFKMVASCGLWPTLLD